MKDPYAALDAHVVSVKALCCEDGCGRIEVSGYSDDKDAAEELAKYGWAVRPHSMGGLTALCKDCAERYDKEHTHTWDYSNTPGVNICTTCGALSGWPKGTD